MQAAPVSKHFVASGVQLVTNVLTSLLSSSWEMGDSFSPEGSQDEGSSSSSEDTQWTPLHWSRSSMQSEIKRLQTFQLWPASVPVAPTDLAAAGFYFVGPADTVQCFCCGGLLYNWVAEEDPMVEHKKFFPSCLYVQNKIVGNIQQMPWSEEHQDCVDGQFLGMLQSLNVEESPVGGQPEYPYMETEGDRKDSLMGEEEPGDKKFSDDESLVPDWPTFTDLFQPALFKSFLYKAKTTANMGVTDAPPETSLSLDPTEWLFSEPFPEQEGTPSPKLFVDVIQQQWNQSGSLAVPSSNDRRFYGSGPDLEEFLQLLAVDTPVTTLASSAILPSDVTEGLKAEDHKMEMTLCKMHQEVAWAIRAATARSFFNRTSLVLLHQLQSRVPPEDTQLYQDINKLVAATEFSSDTTLNAARFATRAMASNVTSSHLLWLHHWQADMRSTWRLASAPFKGGNLFGESLDPILVETRDKKKVLPYIHRQADCQAPPYF
ncbi:PREDICTED: uncharacterized protein LOC106543922 [Thamnophis sirtalis]|uniref:RING-type E3 ubiquitin transferase n=1 Tax=Thamnophis sirtalis TaxID=35019 RepID=A0A6I9XNN6_9SAUR|nr:PREDICTED: uncharacterized protein LOC106543922 [Thamnophis sirtalis]